VRVAVIEIAEASRLRHGLSHQLHPGSAPTFLRRKKDLMSAVDTQNSSSHRSPFSEIRSAHRQTTLAVVATTAVAASTAVITALLVALGIAA
jgi:hypothetical protein